jgi:ubiquitin-protein ligase E3 C
VILPLSTYPAESIQYAQVFAAIVLNILTIPLLPNRVLLDYLPTFISRLPLAKLDTLNPIVPHILTSTSIPSKITLVTHIHMFISPHYKLLPPPAFTTYLQISTSLINGIPLSVFKPPATTGKISSKTLVHEKFDSDSNHAPILPLVVDDKTTKRLQNVIAAPHLMSLISTTQSEPSLFPYVVSYLFALTATWSSSQAEILNAVLASTSGGFVRELYRGLVKRSPLGKEANSGNLFGTPNSSPQILQTDYDRRLRKRTALAACPAPCRPLLPSIAYDGR